MLDMHGVLLRRAVHAQAANRHSIGMQTSQRLFSHHAEVVNETRNNCLFVFWARWMAVPTHSSMMHHSRENNKVMNIPHLLGWEVRMVR